MTLSMEFAQAPVLAQAPELPDIDGAWKALKHTRIKQYPQNNLRASSAGHPCARYHYHSIHDWREKQLHDEILQSIFDEGAMHEKDVIAQLNVMGFQIVEQQRSFQLDKPLITGSIDGILRYKNKDFPFDIKSINPYDFNKIQTIEDLMFSKKIHQRKYPAQLQLYLLMSNNDVGCLIFKNKLTGELKTIFAQIDYDYTEQILKRAEVVYAALAKNEPPKCINDFDACKECPFRHICLPDLKMGEGVIVMDDAELNGLLERREELAPMAKEYKTIDEDVKEVVTAGGQGEKVCGSFFIQVTEHERKNKVPDTWHEEVSKYLRTQIVKLEESVNKATYSHGADEL